MLSTSCSRITSFPKTSSFSLFVASDEHFCPISGAFNPINLISSPFDNLIESPSETYETVTALVCGSKLHAPSESVHFMFMVCD